MNHESYLRPPNVTEVALNRVKRTSQDIKCLTIMFITC